MTFVALAQNSPIVELARGFPFQLAEQQTPSGAKSHPNVLDVTLSLSAAPAVRGTDDYFNCEVEETFDDELDDNQFLTCGLVFGFCND